MHADPRVAFIRWTLASGVVVGIAVFIWALQVFTDSSFSFATASSGTVSTTGPTPTPGPEIGFSDGSEEPGGPIEFISELEVGHSDAGEEIVVAVTGMSPGVHDTLQLLVRYDPAVIEISQTFCTGLFASLFGPLGPVAIAPGESGYVCGVNGGVAAASGTAMKLVVKRVGDGDSELEILAHGPFGAALFSAGKRTPVTSAGALLLVDPPGGEPSDPTPTATSAPAPGGGGSAPPSQASPTQVAPVPGIPSGLNVEAGDGEAHLSWSAPTDNGVQITGYVVRSADGQVSVTLDSAQTSATIGDLTNGREYRFRVQAVSGFNAGPFSELSEAIVPAGPPSAPEALTASVVSSGDDSVAVTLSWAAPLNSNGAEIDSYSISEVEGRVEARTVESEVLSYEFPDLTASEYRFLVSASNRVGAGVAAEIAVTILLAGPVDPAAAAVAAAAQLSIATGESVNLRAGPIQVRPLGATPSIVIPVEHNSEPLSGNRLFTGFSVGDLTVHSERGKPSTAVLDLGGGAEIRGVAGFRAEPDHVVVEIKDATLRVAAVPGAAAEGPPTGVSEPMFETPIISMTELPALEIIDLDTIGPPQFPDPAEFDSILLDLGWAVAGEGAVAGVETFVPGSAWEIVHTASGLEVGDTTFSFTLVTPDGQNPSLIAVKRDDSGAVHVRPATCEGSTALGPVRCVAVFDGAAAGFSSFTVLEASPVEPPPRSTEEPTTVSDQNPTPPAGPTATATSTPAPDPTPGSVPTPTPAPAPQPTSPPTPVPAVGIPENTDSGTGTPSIIVLVALGSVVAVTLAASTRFVLARRAAGNGPGVPLLLIVMSAALAIASQGGATISASGAVVSQGDAAQLSDQVRSHFGVDGTGITVGIISDSIGCDVAGLAADIAAGELPADLNVVTDAAPIECPATTDRGRALAQLVHDVAPGADILFRSALASKGAFAAGIRDLAAAGADVIVDDRMLRMELMFQEDEVVEAIEQVTADGVVYVTSAGDPGIASYESAFAAGGSMGVICGPTNICTRQGNWHDFDPGAGTDQLLEVSLADETARFMLQWDQPAIPGEGSTVGSDMDLYVFDADGATIAASAGENTLSGVPAEDLIVSGFDSVQVAISQASGVEPGLVKLVITNGVVIEEFATDSSTIIAHRNAADAITVGPVNYADTAAFGGTPAVEPRAPVGGAEISFDRDGSELTTPVVRQKPDLVAPSGTDTTMGSLEGSPAAAAHVAGAVALLLDLGSDLHELSPETIRSLLTQTAVEVGAAGPDLTSGHGLVDVFAAANVLATDPPKTVDDEYSTDMNAALDVAAPGVLENDSDSNGDALQAELVAEPEHGAVVLQPDGSFTYTPDEGFLGDDTFTYIARDGTFASVPATVTVTVNPIEALFTTVTLEGVDPSADFGAATVLVWLTGDDNRFEKTVVPGGPGHVLFTGVPPGNYNVLAGTLGYLAALAPDVELGEVPGNVVVLPPVELPAGDADLDGGIDIFDVFAVVDAHGTVHPPGDRWTGIDITDLNGDGFTNGADASLTISNLGLVEPVPWPN